VRVVTIDKQDNSPVTVADYASQAIVCATLKRDFPFLPVVGEEGSSELKKKENNDLLLTVTQQVAAQIDEPVDTSDVLAFIDHGGADADADAFWTLDPIDGTKGFLRGGQYAIALALIEQGEVTLGVLGCPNMQVNDRPGALFVASKGSPTRVYQLFNSEYPGRCATMSAVSEPAQARFCESVEAGHSNQELTLKIARYLGIKQPPFRIDSQCKYAAVAQGDAEIYLRLPVDENYKEKIWDHAAGKIIVEQAGGKVTDMQGRPLDFSCGKYLSKNAGVVASTALIHKVVQQAVDKVYDR